MEVNDMNQTIGKKLYERYKEEIKKFFREDDEVMPGSLKREGNVWIARHPNVDGNQTHFETLTVEPPEGGQYEIVVRFPGIDGKWSGYHITEDGYMIGVNTNGH